jgi:hypothetical protein
MPLLKLKSPSLKLKQVESSGPNSIQPILAPDNNTLLDGSNCHLLKNKRKCNNDPSCTWVYSVEDCIPRTEQPPTAPPTNDIHCQSLPIKRRCKKDPLCEWNDAIKVCISRTEPTTTTTSSTISSSTPPNSDASNICLTYPQDVYRTCFQRAIDPSNDLSEDAILRDNIAPHTAPYIAEDEESNNETVYLSLVRSDNAQLTCDDQIKLEEIALEWLKVRYKYHHHIVDNCSCFYSTSILIIY